jgi:hypothetical protein
MVENAWSVGPSPERNCNFRMRRPCHPHESRVEPWHTMALPHENIWLVGGLNPSGWWNSQYMEKWKMFQTFNKNDLLKIQQKWWVSFPSWIASVNLFEASPVNFQAIKSPPGNLSFTTSIHTLGHGTVKRWVTVTGKKVSMVYFMGIYLDLQPTSYYNW